MEMSRCHRKIGISNLSNLSKHCIVFMVPSGNLLQFAIENGPVEIVDLPWFTY